MPVKFNIGLCGFERKGTNEPLLDINNLEVPYSLFWIDFNCKL